MNMKSYLCALTLVCLTSTVFAAQNCKYNYLDKASGSEKSLKLQIPKQGEETWIEFDLKNDLEVLVTDGSNTNDCPHDDSQQTINMYSCSINSGHCVNFCFKRDEATSQSGKTSNSLECAIN